MAAFSSSDEKSLNELKTLARLYYKHGHLPEAREILEQLIALQRDRLGDGHKDLAKSLHRLAELHRDLGNYAQAEALCVQAQEIWQRHYPLDSISVLAYRQASEPGTLTDREFKPVAEQESRTAPTES